jgi:type III restriction enzyme
VNGQRPARYIAASEASSTFDDPETSIPLQLVNRIRERVDTWRDAGYPGITSITKELLQYWKNPDRELRFFFCPFGSY